VNKSLRDSDDASKKIKKRFHRIWLWKTKVISSINTCSKEIEINSWSKQKETFSHSTDLIMQMKWSKCTLDTISLETNNPFYTRKEAQTFNLIINPYIISYLTWYQCIHWSLSYSMRTLIRIMMIQLRQKI
jgi:hypothetical protein